MFTGIIEEKGNVVRVISGSRSGEIMIGAKTVLIGTKVGDSIAVNGVCLTVTEITGDGFCADVMPETLSRTNLGSLKTGDKVNLERAMSAQGRFGGHIVSGHIDGTGKIESITRDENAIRVRISAPATILKYIIEKGSVCIDGISLTVTDVDDTAFGVSLIPHTAGETTLASKKAGDTVNLENDIIGKYVDKLIRFTDKSTDKKLESRITLEFLQQHGF